MNDIAPRLVGRKAILNVISKMYGIETWWGAVLFIRRRRLPLRRTPSGKPMFYEHELIEYDRRFQKVLTKN